MKPWHAVLLFWVIVVGSMLPFFLEPVGNPSEAVVVASLPPEPVPAIPPRVPDSIPVYRAADEPQATEDAARFSAPPELVPAAVEAPAEPAPPLVILMPVPASPPSSVHKTLPEMHKKRPVDDPGSRRANIRPPPAPPPALPVAEPPPAPPDEPAQRPPVEQRWQSTIARTQRPADWRTQVNGGP